MSVQLRSTEASKTWGVLIRSFSRIEKVLAAEMADETGMALERYGILLMLAQADNGTMRPSDLAEALPITRSGTTRLVDRLESEGLVERRECESDRRGNVIALTSKGEDIFRRAGRVHLRGIDEHVGGPLTTDELRQLRALLTKLDPTAG